MTIWSGAVGVAVLVGAGVVMWDTLVEEYYLQRLQDAEAPEEVRERAFKALWGMGSTRAFPVVLRIVSPWLGEGLRPQPGYIKSEPLLCYFQCHREAIWPDLCAALQDADVEVRRTAAHVIYTAMNYSIPESYRAGVPVPEDVELWPGKWVPLKPGGWFPRTEGDEILPVLRSLVRDGDRVVSLYGVQSLVWFGAEGLPDYRSLLVHRDDLLRERAVMALPGKPRWVNPVVPELCALTQDESDLIRACAAMLLEHATAHVDDALSALTGLLTNEGEVVRVRVAAVQSLGRIGRGSPRAVEVLKQALEDPDEQVRDVAEQSLRQIEDSVPAGSGERRGNLPLAPGPEDGGERAERMQMPCARQTAQKLFQEDSFWRSLMTHPATTIAPGKARRLNTPQRTFSPERKAMVKPNATRNSPASTPSTRTHTGAGGSQTCLQSAHLRSGSAWNFPARF